MKFQFEQKNGSGVEFEATSSDLESTDPGNMLLSSSVASAAAAAVTHDADAGNTKRGNFFLSFSPHKSQTIGSLFPQDSGQCFNSTLKAET